MTVSLSLLVLTLFETGGGVQPVEYSNKAKYEILKYILIIEN